MERVDKKLLIDGVSVKLEVVEIDLTKKEIRAVIDAYEETVVDFIMKGNEVPIHNLGTFKFKEVDAKPERPNTLPIGGDILEATPEYSRLMFKVNSALRKAVREKTEGNVFK